MNNDEYIQHLKKQRETRDARITELEKENNELFKKGIEYANEGLEIEKDFKAAVEAVRAFDDKNSKQKFVVFINKNNIKILFDWWCKKYNYDLKYLKALLKLSKRI